MATLLARRLADAGLVFVDLVVAQGTCVGADILELRFEEGLAE